MPTVKIIERPDWAVPDEDGQIDPDDEVFEVLIDPQHHGVSDGTRVRESWFTGLDGHHGLTLVSRSLEWRVLYELGLERWRHRKDAEQRRLTRKANSQVGQAKAAAGKTAASAAEARELDRLRRFNDRGSRRLKALPLNQVARMYLMREDHTFGALNLSEQARMVEALLRRAREARKRTARKKHGA